MLQNTLPAIALFLSICAVPSLIPTAEAQTSFGGSADAAPTNSREWADMLNNELMRNIRTADSSLAVHGIASKVSPALGITVARNGQITDIRLVKTSGNAALDKAIIRAASRTKQVAPFTADMQGQAISFTLQLDTVRR
ncbi:TonB family protein [Paracoccus alkanivorans]|uniref:TonB family protein n=1 Tax=Paracoccus alkanivorans TaxID=2116655 RepID=A0A3M0MJD5_9RHOB|nr:TonB family protein [Paracoccus alkanivorans]RMC37711.1 TonB family protein [Paracoccus alkanivorans]